MLRQATKKHDKQNDKDNETLGEIGIRKTIGGGTSVKTIQPESPHLLPVPPIPA